MSEKRPICFYHGDDFDGQCSAAIVYWKHNNNIDLVPISYGQNFDWDSVLGREVIMVDFGLQPFDQMEKLKSVTSKLTWIDHHKTAIDAAKEVGFETDGLLREGDAACELCWEYFCSDQEIPKGVHYLGRYDVWKHKGVEGALEFQYGLKLYDTNPKSHIWTNIICDFPTVDAIVVEGKNILRYQNMMNAECVRHRAFETDLQGYRAIACNIGIKTGSMLFDSIWDDNKYDIMIVFNRTPDRSWGVSLYTTDVKDIDVGAIAKHYGGGGHPQASGFQCDELPFVY